MANLELMMEAERRGILPPDKQALLGEAKKRGLISGGTETQRSTAVAVPDAEMRMEPMATQEAAPPREKPSIARSALQAFGQGVTFGTMDEIQAGLATPILAAIEPGDNDWGETYDRALKVSQQLDREKREANPGTSIAADIGGSIISGRGLLKLGSKLPGAAMAKANPKKAIALGSGLMGAAQGYTRGEGDADSDSRMLGAGLGGAIGLPAPFAMGLAGKGIKAGGEYLAKTGAGQKASQVARKGIAALDDLPKYIEKSPAVRGARDWMSGQNTIDRAAQNYRAKVAQMGEEAVAQFDDSLKKGLPPEAAARRARAKSLLGADLSEGDATRDFFQQSAEENALKGNYGAQVQQTARNFREKQNAQVAAGVQGRFGEPQNLADVGEGISGSLRSKEAEAAKAARGAYKNLDMTTAEIPKTFIGQVAKETREALGRFDVKRMPTLKEILNDLDDLGKIAPAPPPEPPSLVQQLGGIARPKPQPLPIEYANLQKLEHLRQRTSNIPVNNSAEATAASIVRHKLNAAYDKSLNDALVKGDPKVIDQLKNARSLWNAWKDTFESTEGPEKFVAEVVSENLNGAQVMQKLFSAGDIGSARGAAQVVDTLEQVLGKNSPEMAQLKQHAFYRVLGDDFADILANDGRLTVKGGKIAGNINRFFKNNKPLADKMFTPQEQETLQEMAKAFADVTVKQEGVVNFSNSANKIINALNGLVGGGVMSKMTFGTSRVLTGGIAMARKAAQEASDLSKVEKAFRGEISKLADQRLEGFQREALAGTLAARIGSDAAGLTAQQFAKPAEVNPVLDDFFRLRDAELNQRSEPKPMQQSSAQPTQEEIAQQHRLLMQQFMQ